MTIRGLDLLHSGVILSLQPQGIIVVKIEDRYIEHVEIHVGQSVVLSEKTMLLFKGVDRRRPTHSGCDRDDNACCM
jgi:hypothetical protein